MKSALEHLETLKAKPHHVRKRIAFTTAGLGAAVLGLAFFGVSLASGTYAIKGSNFADVSGAAPQVATTSPSGELAGAAAALDQSASAPAHIEIVDASSSSPTATAKPTVIPF